MPCLKYCEFAVPWSQTVSNFRDTSVRVEVLGQGASGTVYKMVHVPSLTIVAAKVGTDCANRMVAPSLLSPRVAALCLPTVSYL